MRCALVAPYSVPQTWMPYMPHLGIASLAGALEQEGHAVSVLDFYGASLLSRLPGERPQAIAWAAERVLSEDPEMVGISTICISLHVALLLAEAIRQRDASVKIVLGGPQVGSIPQRVLQIAPWVDAVCVGEGEWTLLGIVEGFQSGSLDGRPGVVYRAGGQVHRGPDAPLIENLDDLPMPAFHLFPDARGGYALETARGCPHACAYCSISPYWRRKVRTKSAGRVRREIEAIRAAAPGGAVSDIFFVDDNFATRRGAVVDLCAELSAAGVPWSCNTRVDSLDEDLVARMADAGCRQVCLGIETASPRLQRSLGKNLDLECLPSLLDALDHHGIAVALSFVYGFPDETEAELRQTLRLIGSLSRPPARYCRVCPLVYENGSPLYERHRSELAFFEPNLRRAGADDPAARALIAGNEDVFPHLCQVPGTAPERFPDLEAFVTLGFGTVAGHLPKTWQALLTIFRGEVMDLFLDLRASAGGSLLGEAHADPNPGESETRAAALRLLLRYLRLRAPGDFRFRLALGLFAEEARGLRPTPGGEDPAAGG